MRGYALRIDENLIRLIPIVPSIGFVLALCQEFAFFWHLGVNPNDLMTVGDIVRVSVFNVLPVVPLVLLSIWLNDYERYSGPTKTTREKIYAAYDSGGSYLFVAIISFSAFAFLLFGWSPVIGTLMTYIWLILLFARIVIVPMFIQYEVPYKALVFIYLLMCVVFAGYGAVDALQIRSGDRSNLPRLNDHELEIVSAEPLFVLKTFSNGVLVGTDVRDKIWFVSDSLSRTLEFNINPNPYAGFLCNSFEWCAFSGWRLPEATDQ